VMASTLSGYSPAGFSCVLHGTSNLADEQPGASGLTPRAAGVAAAAAREAGRRDVTAATTDGKTLRFTVPSAEENRYGWSLAQWAVARANKLHVIAVQVGDRKWHRDDSTEGWTASKEQLPAGAVVVRVA